MSRAIPGAARTALAALAATLALAVAPAHGQGPPAVPDVAQRSGVVSRMTPARPTLPPDPDRDKFYDTYFGDYPKRLRTNSCKNGGLYGLPLPADCTKCVPPYFQGYPGEGGIRPGCEPPKHRAGRWVTNFFHPWRPVCYYYHGGAYVPVYDLDPLVTGPGPFPWPVFFRRCNGG
jgi:hypothetical protein